MPDGSALQCQRQRSPCLPIEHDGISLVGADNADPGILSQLDQQVVVCGNHGGHIAETIADSGIVCLKYRKQLAPKTIAKVGDVQVRLVEAPGEVMPAAIDLYLGSGDLQ
jgi:hypothetical protein